MDKFESIRKLKVMSERGATADERDTARRLMENLCNKYGINQGRIDEPVRHWHEITINYNHHYKLFVQIVWTVCGDNFTAGRKKKSQRTYLVRCTDLEYVEIMQMYAYYSKTYESEFKKFHSAFISKYEIFNPELVKYSGKLPDLSEVFMMNAMTSKKYTPFKMIEED